MILEGLLLDLVPWTDAFEQHMVDWANGPMGAFWSEDGLLIRSRRERWLAERHERGRQDLTFGMRAKDGTRIGLFGLFHLDDHNRVAEVGAGIGDPAYWGGGFGSDAMLLICEYAFNWLDLRRLYLDTMGHNVRAQRQVEKCGFTLEARHRREAYDMRAGTYRDGLHYGLLRAEWPGREALVARLGLREKAQTYLDRVETANG